MPLSKGNKCLGKLAVRAKSSAANWSLFTSFRFSQNCNNIFHINFPETTAKAKECEKKSGKEIFHGLCLRNLRRQTLFPSRKWLNGLNCVTTENVLGKFLLINHFRCSNISCTFIEDLLEKLFEWVIASVE